MKPFFGKSPIRKGLSQTCGGRKQTKRNTTTNELCKWRFLSLEINGHHHKKQQNSLKSTTRIFIPERSLTARLPQKNGGKGRTIQFLLGFGNFSAVNSLLIFFFFGGGGGSTFCSRMFECLAPPFRFLLKQPFWSS